MDFFNSNLFQSLVILVTATFIFAVYFISKKNEKREAAIILLDEIRSAEKAIDEIRRNRIISELNVIMPANSWVKYKHLFAKELSQDEFALITQFYNSCEHAEKYRRIIYDILNDSVLEKAKYVQARLIDLMAEEVINETDLYNRRRTSLIDRANEEDWLFEASRPKEEMLSYLTNIQFITPVTCGEKLRKISRKGIIYRLFSRHI